MRTNAFLILVLFFLVFFSCKNTQKESVEETATVQQDSSESIANTESYSETENTVDEVRDSIVAESIKETLSEDNSKVEPQNKTTKESNSSEQVVEMAKKDNMPIPPPPPEIEEIQETDIVEEVPAQVKQIPDIDVFFADANTFFRKYVKNNKVNYAGIKSNKIELDELTALISRINVSKSNKNKYQAFLINAYNLGVIKGVVDSYPISSPLDNQSFFKTKKYNVGGTNYSLDDIEHKLLRKNFSGEARFHFVLVCGALGCPPLINQAYKPSNINSLLTSQTKKAVNNKNFIRVDDANKTVKISEIFKWFKEDFDANGGELKFINQYRNSKIPSDYKVEYYPYDWKLNKI